MNPKSNSFTHIFHVFFSSFLVNPRPSLRAGIYFFVTVCRRNRFTSILNRDKIKVVCPYQSVTYRLSFYIISQLRNKRGNTVTWHNLVPAKNPQKAPAVKSAPPPAAAAAAGVLPLRAAVHPHVAASRPAAPSAVPRLRTLPAASCWWALVCSALRLCSSPGRTSGAHCAAGTSAFSASPPIWSAPSCCTLPICWHPATALQCLRARCP